MRSVCVLPGDGVGPEVVGCAVRVLDEVTDQLELHYSDIGRESFVRTGRYLSDDTLEAMRASDSCIFGAVTSSEGKEYDSPVLKFRKELGLYANLRPVKSMPHVSATDVDLLIVRENTEGLYTMDEVEDGAGVTTRRRVTRVACTRIVDKAIEEARRRRRRSLCCIHKANVLRQSDGLFLEVFRERSEAIGTGLHFTDQLVDSAAAKLVMSPGSFDVIVTLNLYGDILSDLAAGVVGGLGFAPSGNVGDVHSVFEPAHGSAPDIAGTGQANPTATILSAAMMLDHLGLGDEARLIHDSVERAYASGIRTFDVGGSVGSGQFTDEVVGRIKGRNA
jgi:isopropylmalate/isohomocitrate dehydrogenase-like protein